MSKHHNNQLPPRHASRPELARRLAEGGPYHPGPPAIGSLWETSEESREVVGVLDGHGISYLVRYRLSRGWPRKSLGETACTGTEWCNWSTRDSARQQPEPDETRGR